MSNITPIRPGTDPSPVSEDQSTAARHEDGTDSNNSAKIGLIVASLEQARSLITTTVHALREQAVDDDHHFADVLEAAVSRVFYATLALDDKHCVDGVDTFDAIGALRGLMRG